MKHRDLVHDLVRWANDPETRPLRNIAIVPPATLNGSNPMLDVPVRTVSKHDVLQNKTLGDVDDWIERLFSEDSAA